VGLNGGGAFKGGAVLSADQNIVASTSQVSNNTAVNQLMSTAFGGSDATPKLYLTTFLHNWGFTYSTFSVQNTEAEAINYSAKFYDVGNPVAIATVNGQIPAYSVKQFSAWISSTINSQFQNWVTTVGSQGQKGRFTGSVVVDATFVSNGQPARTVGISEERLSSNNRGYAFEAIAQSAGSTTVYVPTALCNFGGATTFLAVQNLGNAASDYTVTYLNTAGATVATQPVNGVGAGSKKSFNPCQVLGSLSGSARVTGSQPATVIGKAQDLNNYTTAYLGQSTGSQRLAIPNVRWDPAGNDLRAFIAVQNIGASIPAGQISLTYYNTNGSVFRTCTSINTTVQSAKVNTNPGQGAATATMSCNGSAPVSAWSGSAIIQGPSGSQLIAINRSLVLNNPKVTEDINGVAIP
jgi:hypothetical protein